jgi:hypothetical protein
MERGLTMLCHSIIIAAVLYVIMVFVLKQRPHVAENRSLLIASFTLMYMLLFGHGMPTKINKHLFV